MDEAILLADRILVLTGAPGTVREDIPVDLARPRDPTSDSWAVAARLKREIWAMLEQEVRKFLYEERL